MPTQADLHHHTNAGGQLHAATTPDTPADIGALYRRIAEHSQIPIAMTAGRAHRLCGANPAFCQLLGAESEALLLGQSLVDAVPASDTDRVRALLDRVYGTGTASREDSPQPTHSERDQTD